MYESPIKLYTDHLIQQEEKAQEEAVFKCLLNIGVNVNKEELVKALSYDREQYSKGYQDAMNSIVRCRDCIFYKLTHLACGHPDHNGHIGIDGFCSDGERKGDDG